MINCPKCGFRQPKDEFCAQCGVHMDSFQPEVTPLGRRLAKNLRTWGSLIIAVLILVAILGYRQWFHQGPRNEMSFSLNQAIPEAPYRDPASANTRYESTSLENSAASASVEMTAPDSELENARTSHLVDDPKAEALKTAPNQIQFRFTMDRAGDLFELLDGVAIAEQGEWNGWSFGLVRQLEQFASQSAVFDWMPALPGSYPLEHQRRLDLELPAAQENLSLQFDVVFLSTDAEKGILISLQHLPGGDDVEASAPQSDPIDFWIPPQSYGYVAGLLPKATEDAPNAAEPATSQEENLAFMVLFQPVYNAD